jgi:hypothetical protein
MAPMRSLRPWLALPAWLALTAACAGGGGAAPAGSGRDPVGSLGAVVRAARADAARLTGLEPGAIEVVSAEPVTWRDGSLGCPQPGRLYTMALVPGYRVVLRVQGRQYDYHAGARGAPLLCPDGRAVDPLPDDRR